MTTEEAFWAKVAKGDGCWEWQGAHAEAVAARLVEVVCKQERTQQIHIATIYGLSTQADVLEAERDAARAEAERLRSPEWEAEVRADERSKVVAEYATWGPTVAMYTAEQVEENVEQARVEIAQWQTIANAVQTERDELIAEVAALREQMSRMYQAETFTDTDGYPSTRVFKAEEVGQNEWAAHIRRAVLADLRAKVEALYVRCTDDPWRNEELTDWVRRDAVLALLDGVQP